MRLRHLLIAALVGLACGHLGAATFTATGVSSDVQVTPGNTLTVALSGTWVATVNVERKVGSSGYLPIYTTQSNVTYTITDPGTYHLNCAAFTSGTVTYALTAPAGYQVNYLGPNGKSVFSVDNAGVVTAPSIVASATTITGGTVDGTPIGATTPSTGAFTTLTASGATTLTAGTASTTSGTGTLVVTGGEGISGDVFAGASLNAATTITAGGTVRRNASLSSDVCFATFYTGGNFAFYVAADGTLNWGPSSATQDTFLTRNAVGQLIASANTASSSTTTGGLVLTGGEGIGGALNVGGAIAGASSIKSSSATAGVGYATGAGGAVTQATSKATTVVLNTACGTITMNAASLASVTSVAFTLTDSAIAATDVIVCVHDSVGTLGGYSIVVTPASGSATVTVRNNTAGALAEAIVLRFAVIKATVN